MQNKKDYFIKERLYIETLGATMIDGNPITLQTRTEYKKKFTVKSRIFLKVKRKNAKNNIQKR